MNRRSFFRGGSARMADGYARLANIANFGTLVQGSSLSQRFSRLRLTQCFVTTNEVRHRLSDLAYCGLVEHYVRCEASRHGDMNTLRIRATVMGVMSLGWLSSASTTEDPPAAEYDRINSVLNREPVNHATYIKVLASWNQAVLALELSGEPDASLRGAYHHQQLHYIHPLFVGDESAQIVRDFCNLRLAGDLVVPAQFAVAELTEEVWTTRWRDLGLPEKLRWFEFAALMDFASMVKRANSYLIGALFAICKMGTMEETWVASRLLQMETHGRIQLDKTIVSRDVMTLVFTEFVAGSKATIDDIYNNLVARYYNGTISGIAPINWVIEQTSLAGAASVSLVADVCKAYKLTMGMLVQAGVPKEDFAAWAQAVCELSRNRLIAIKDSPINSARFKFLQLVCKEVVGNNGYRDYLGGEGRAGLGTASIAKQVALLTKNMVNARMQTTTAPDHLLRAVYDQVVETLPNGRFRCRPRVAGEEVNPDQEWREADTVMELLVSCPLSVPDMAFFTLCDHALMAGQQDKWEIRSLAEVDSPNRPVPPHIIEAARAIGFEWVERDDTYRMPPEIGRGTIYPAWDLGCLDRDPIPRPRGAGPRGGGPGGDDDDAGDDHRGDYPDYDPQLDDLDESKTLAVLAGECLLVEALGLEPAIQARVQPGPPANPAAVQVEASRSIPVSAPLAPERAQPALVEPIAGPSRPASENVVQFLPDVDVPPAPSDNSDSDDSHLDVPTGPTRRVRSRSRELRPTTPTTRGGRNRARGGQAARGGSPLSKRGRM